MSVLQDPDEVRAAYEEVRDDGNETKWCLCNYDGKKVVVAARGEEYSELLEHFAEDERCYAYVRFETGDEMSRRAKFAFITWIGPSVSPLKKAKVSTDKAFIKEIWNQFGKEILADERNDVKEGTVLSALEKASGAAYGTGK